MDSACVSNFVQTMEVEDPVEKEEIESIFSNAADSEIFLKEDLSVTDSGVTLSEGTEEPMVPTESTSKHDDINPVLGNMPCMTNSGNQEDLAVTDSGVSLCEGTEEPMVPTESTSKHYDIHCDDINPVLDNMPCMTNSGSQEDLAVTDSGISLTTETEEPMVVTESASKHDDHWDDRSPVLDYMPCMTNSENQEDLVVTDSSISLSTETEEPVLVTESTSKYDNVHCNDISPVLDDMPCMTNSGSQEDVAVTDSGISLSTETEETMVVTESASKHGNVHCDDISPVLDNVPCMANSENQADLAVTDSSISLSMGSEEPMVVTESTSKYDNIHCAEIRPVLDNVPCMTKSQNPVQNTASNVILIYDKSGNEDDSLNPSHDPSVSGGNTAEQGTVKGKKDETADSSSMQKLEVSDHNASLIGQLSSSGDITKTPNFSHNFDNVIKMEDNHGEGGCGPINGSASDAYGGPSILELEKDQNGSSKASPELKVPKKRKRQAPEIAVSLSAGREKRLAFKKCTEWFKLLTGEMHANHFCVKCGASFSSSRELKSHKYIHDVKKADPDELDEQASQVESVVAERLEYKDRKSYECPECYECFSSKSGLTRHQAKHSVSSKPDLKHPVSPHSSLTRRQAKHAGLRVYHCELCDQTFLSKGVLQAHVSSHTHSRDYIRHRITMLKTPVSRVRKFKCQQCDARFSQQWSLDQHRLIHTRLETDFECKECKERFADITLLVKHQESHSYQKLYQCSECDERFSHKTNLYKHQLSHVNQRKVECSECGEIFPERSQLKIHLFSVHGTENVCVCGLCNKFFSKQATLKRHLLTHSERQAFKCPVCNETFAQKSTLTRHSVLHAGEQFYRFTCSVCDRKFSRRETLNAHIRTHTGEKPFICEVCHEGFSQKSAMKRHQILHFKERRGKRSIRSVDMDTGATEEILLSLVYTDS